MENNTDNNQDTDIALLKNNFKIMLEQNAQEHKELKKTLDKIINTLDCMVDKLDKRYAPMYVKSIMVWAGGIIGSFLILFGLSKIFIK